MTRGRPVVKKCFIDDNKCSYTEMESCTCCQHFLDNFSVIVYCNDTSCAFFTPLPFKHELKHHKDYKPFDDCYYTGVCGKGEIGMKKREVSTALANYKFCNCTSRSDKKISGHVDFSRFPQQAGPAE